MKLQEGQGLTEYVISSNVPEGYNNMRKSTLKALWAREKNPHIAAEQTFQETYTICESLRQMGIE